MSEFLFRIEIRITIEVYVSIVAYEDVKDQYQQLIFTHSEEYIAACSLSSTKWTSNNVNIKFVKYVFHHSDNLFKQRTT